MTGVEHCPGKESGDDEPDGAEDFPVCMGVRQCGVDRDQGKHAEQEEAVKIPHEQFGPVGPRPQHAAGLGIFGLCQLSPESQCIVLAVEPVPS